MMAIDCLEYGLEIVFKGGTQQVTSPNVTTAHAAPTPFDDAICVTVPSTAVCVQTAVPIPCIKLRHGLA